MNTRYTHGLERVAFGLGYRVRDDGLVAKPNGKLITGGVGRTSAPRYYPRFRLKTGATSSVLVHRLAAFQMWGSKIYEPGLVVRHLDDNPANTRPKNLALGTDSDNSMGRRPEDRTRCAIVASSKTKKHDHAAIVAAWKSGQSYKAIMRSFGISSKGTVSFIIRQSLANKDAGTSPTPTLIGI